MHILYFESIPVPCFGVGASWCLEMMVTGCWLCHSDKQPAVGLLPGFLVASLTQLGLFTPIGPVEKLLGRF